MEKGSGISSFFSRKSQVTIFVVIAIILVVLIGGYFLARTFIFPSVPTEVKPIYDYYSSCISQTLKDGANIMESQGGYIYYDAFEPGSQYAPFSSTLDFLGMGIPYWYYISGNGEKKEQIPTKQIMQDQLGKYLSEKLSRCDLSSFREQGYVFQITNPSSSKVILNDETLSASLSQDIIISKDGNTYTLKNFNVNAESRLGSLYNNAKKIYDYEMKNEFLENYSVDVLYNYAPVSGVVTNCSPVVWSPYDVFNNLKSGLSANIGSLKVNGNYYALKNKNSAYFVVGKAGDLNVQNSLVNFLYSPDWPARFEVWPTKSNLMTVTPMGTQPGLSTMGFCYSPYKFVYDMFFPVLIQLTTTDGLETFQFPVSVIINKNMPRESLESNIVTPLENICDRANTDLRVNTYNINLNPIEANIEFKCIANTCNLGSTKIEGNDSSMATLTTRVPQCGNGILTASADGYREKTYSISTNEENTADIILDKEYSLGVELYVDGNLVKNNALVLISEVTDNETNFVDSVSYPLSNAFKISEGNYKFALKVYGNGNINIPATTTKQCFQTAQSGVLGFFGLTSEKCVDVNVPSQTITSVPVAGGYVYQYITPNMLENSKILRIYATSVKTPTTIDEVQQTFDNVDQNKISIELV